MGYNALKFTISGKSAFFKKPDVNERIYFTYNNIHRIALLGILGAIIGLDGYKNYQLFNEKVPDYPEYYKKLNPLKISIVPNAKRGYFPKKIQYFNNSTGFASQEEGGNLMVREQWLDNPSWTIYLMQGDAEYQIWDKLCEYILQQKCVYYPYLGKNNFPATLSECSIVELKEGNFSHVDSLFYGEMDQIANYCMTDELPYLFREMSPAGMVKKHNFYQLKWFIFTSYGLTSTYGLHLLSYNDKVLCFN